jgi:hypothetical protein
MILANVNVFGKDFTKSIDVCMLATYDSHNVIHVFAVLTLTIEIAKFCDAVASKAEVVYYFAHILRIIR